MTRRDAAAVILGLFASSMVFAWLLIGDLTDEPDLNPDYLFGAFEPSEGAQAAVGTIAFGVLAYACVVLWSRVGLDRRGWPVVGFSLTAGIGAAWAARVVTAGVSGANIGGGLLLFVAPVVVSGLLATAVHRAQRLLTAPPDHGRSPVSLSLRIDRSADAEG